MLAFHIVFDTFHKFLTKHKKLTFLKIQIYLDFSKFNFIYVYIYIYIYIYIYLKFKNFRML